MLNIEKYLVHKASVYHKLSAGSGEAWQNGNQFDVPIQNVKCFAYFGDLLLAVGGVPVDLRTIESAPSRWQVILPLTFANTLQVGDKIDSIVDKAGISIREAGYVEEANLYRHPWNGTGLVLAKLGDG